MIIVGKRHHTRFYPTITKDIDERDHSFNCKNGTVVDRGVTEQRNWDFSLQTHSAIKGTARLAHYYIILNEIFKQKDVRYPHENVADVIEDLTHSMCYLFGRATQAVSICPPAYYADVVCERARRYLSGYFDAQTSAGTPTVGGSGNLGEPTNGDVRVHELLKDSMFYIRGDEQR